MTAANGYAGFAINEALCVECGQCRRFCPVKDAITIDERYQHVVNSDICTGCGLCEAFCPVPNAIFPITSQPVDVLQRRKYLVQLRRVVWRGKWLFHDHPLMDMVTVNARTFLRTRNRQQRNEISYSVNFSASRKSA